MNVLEMEVSVYSNKEQLQATKIINFKIYISILFVLSILDMFCFFQASLLDLKEHASSLASSGLKKDSRLKTLEIALEQKKEECLKMESQLKKVKENFSTFLTLL